MLNAYSDRLGNIPIWTKEEFESEFGMNPMLASISVCNRASGASGIFLATPRFNGESVYTTMLSAQGGTVAVEQYETMVPIAYTIVGVDR